MFGPSQPARNARAAVLAAALLLATTTLLTAGCGGPPPGAIPPEAPPGYLQLRETFGPRDFGPLAGRRIVLDPGHGGHFRGAIGPGGLAEADVNLGVALNLRGLLEWAGAQVFMTRTADYDFLTPADSTLATDLAFRVSFTDSIKPDVFISIHHNSTASGDPTINETQTYYPLDDDGASVDLAKAIHRHLVLNLEIAPARILPGNFRVLRDATVPAVLGEPAMISHPVMAGRLSQAAAQRLEAEAYFLGLLDYFAGGDPRWLAAQPDTLTVGDADTLLAWTFADDSPAAPAPDPATFTVRADGRRGGPGPHARRHGAALAVPRTRARRDPADHRRRQQPGRPTRARRHHGGAAGPGPDRARGRGQRSGRRPPAPVPTWPARRPRAARCRGAPWAGPAWARRACCRWATAPRRRGWSAAATAPRPGWPARTAPGSRCTRASCPPAWRLAPIAGAGRLPWAARLGGVPTWRSPGGRRHPPRRCSPVVRVPRPPARAVARRPATRRPPRRWSRPWRAPCWSWILPAAATTPTAPVPWACGART